MGFRINCTRLSFNCVCFCCTKNNQTISNIIHPFLRSGDKKIIQIIINNNHDQKTKIAGVFMVIMTSLLDEVTVAFKDGCGQEVYSGFSRDKTTASAHLHIYTNRITAHIS